MTAKLNTENENYLNFRNLDLIGLSPEKIRQNF